MYEVGKIEYSINTEDGLYMQVFIPKMNSKYIEGKEIKECGIWFNDNRHITADQRKKIYATLFDIAEYTGYGPDDCKERMKHLFIAEKGVEEFSLSDCSLTLASEFIDFLIDFCFKENIPLSDLGIKRTCNVTTFLYLCLKYRRCCICGKPADEHHVDAIGMGNNRRKIDDSKHLKMALCREHHEESHTIGQCSFCEKYHVYGITYNENEEDILVPILKYVGKIMI